MQLADFIEGNTEAILLQWEAFARSLPAGRLLEVDELRDHAEQMLLAICKDIRRPQTPEQQEQKSHGLALPLDAKETAAQTHAFMRARGGFNINHMVSEYRALRASVLRLWSAACAPADRDAEETIRFNEAIDQALAESTLSFSLEVDRARDLLLGALGHDMRNPLNAIRLTAQYLHNLNAGDEVSVAAQHLIRSGSRIKTLLDDLTDFNRTRLGLGIAVFPTTIDLARVFEDELEVLRAAHPGLKVELECSGELTGAWDGGRLHQVLGNLVQNALHHGTADKVIKVVLTGEDGEVTFTVVNEGKKIPQSHIASMFAPLARGADQPGDSQNLGLGLYVCREIALAHGGSIDARSDDTTTSFTVHLPRDGRAFQPRP